MHHCLEVTTAPYSPGQPRRYYAADYPLGSVVANGCEYYEVRYVGLDLMFVALGSCSL